MANELDERMQELLRRTRHLFSRNGTSAMSDEDARAMVESIAGFITVLRDWEDSERKQMTN
jgi:hypothetical protein